MSWTVFHHQFEAMVGHKNWTAQEKIRHCVLKEQAADVLHK
jgi:hypothetical protein